MGPKRKLKREKITKAQPITVIHPPQAVKSVFVKTAYAVKAITIAAVMKAAASTIKGSFTVAQTKATVYASSMVNANKR